VGKSLNQGARENTVQTNANANSIWALLAQGVIYINRYARSVAKSFRCIG
jgi:hypothetical protein